MSFPYVFDSMCSSRSSATAVGEKEREGRREKRACAWWHSHARTHAEEKKEEEENSSDKLPFFQHVAMRYILLPPYLIASASVGRFSQTNERN